MDKCAAIGYGSFPFSFSSLGELEADAVILLKHIRKFFITQDIGARAAIHIFNRIGFAIARGVGAQIVSRLPPCSACSKVFAGNIYGNHDVSCAGIIGIKHRHNVVHDTLVDICYRSGISAGKKVEIGLNGGRDKLLRPADMLLYSWDRGLDVCVDLTGSSPLTQTGMVDFVSGRAVIDADSVNAKQADYITEADLEVLHGSGHWGTVEKIELNDKIIVSDGSVCESVYIDYKIDEMIRSKQLQTGSIVQLTQFSSNTTFRGLSYISVHDLKVIRFNCIILGDPKPFSGNKTPSVNNFIPPKVDEEPLDPDVNDDRRHADEPTAPRQNCVNWVENAGGKYGLLG
nr:hypothetical protein [Tanacetum cinerariifolium]